MRQCCRIGFPVLAVKLVDGDIKVHPIIQAPPGYGKTVWVGARDVETLYAAGLAEAMFRATRIERVLRKVVRAAQQAKSRRGYDDVNVAAHRTDGTVAVFDLQR